VLLAITAAVAPALVVALLVVAVGFAAGGWLLRAGGGIELLRTTVVAVVGAVVLCLPWLVGLSTDPRALLETFGLPLSRAGAPSLAKVATLAVGPAHPALLNAVLVLAAIVPLVLVRGPRLVVAARLWMVVLLADAVALLGGWHLLGSFTPSTVVVLTPAAMALAVLVALAISSFEVELADWNFGWRQGVGLAGVACASVGLLPLLPSSASGSWQLPAHGVEASLTPISVAAQQVGLRVLWLGDPRILPVSGWSIEPGLAAATTTTDVTSPWGILPAAPAGPAATLGQAATSALQGRTINLGATLGAQAVRYVVVDTSAAPSVTSILAPSSYPAPPNLLRALAQQRDLVLISASGGLTVYLVAEARPLVGRADPAQRSGWANALSPAPDQLGLPTPTRAGAIAIAAAPASSITAAVGGKALSPIATSPSTAVATATAGTLAVAVQPSPWPPLAATGEVALWVLVALALAGRLRRRSTAGVEPAPAPEVEAPALDAELP